MAGIVAAIAICLSLVSATVSNVYIFQRIYLDT
ncbi:hypothetical protein SYNTR_0424 [Candidatus Syntrophocurvum alkaliphilum]|uniref:Uncharacterized protein n=1 Tax=Candidatus Syntrophocurvum alkaliphilum TaxID=2293317 RepID=A0A6I6D948_9FIRM|nr:hypothetical protein SYNTR_0424 [Candidatus Syntrophocurvum alkaliphilum]